MLFRSAPQYTKGFTDQLHTLDIPYIYIDSNIKDVPPLAFFGQNSRQSGYFAARMLMLLARDEKEIVIFRKIHEGIVGSNQQENREIGFRQYMEEYHPSCTILELDLHAERNDEDNEMLDELFRTHPTVKNGITFNSKVYIVGEYLQSHGKKDFNLIGYDLLERNVTCLKERSVSFLIAQQPELQGFNGIKALCEPEDFTALYYEFEQYAPFCRFRGCSHVSEPGCAVKEAVEKGELSPERYERYKNLYKITEENWRKRYD